MKKGDVVLRGLVPAYQDAPETVQPAVCAFHHPTPGFETGLPFDRLGLFAALASRSFRAPQLPHHHERSDRLSSPLCQPQSVHSLDDGNPRSAFTNSAPYQVHLYFSVARKPAMPASATARASIRFFIIPATCKSCTTTRPADLAVAVVALG